MNLQKKIAIQTPLTPNFIRVGKGNASTMGIGEFTDAELRRIAKDWTDNLIEKARKRRAEIKK